MGIFEIYATTSIAFAVAIPTFFEKVMRPGYEKRVEKFRKESLDEFRQSLNEVVDIFNRRNELTDEIGEKMEDVVGSWYTVQSNDKKFEQLIVNRNYITLGWLLTFCWTILSIHSQEIGNIFNFEWPKYVTAIFFILLIITFIYVYSLLDFDKKLSRFSTEEEKLKETKRPSVLSGEVSDTRTLSLEVKSRIIDALHNNNIPFEEEVIVKHNFYDIVVPDRTKPKVIIEIKAFRRKVGLFTTDRIIRMSVFTKREFPQSKFVVFVNDKNLFLTPRTEELLQADVDQIFDFDDLKKFIDFVKTELE